jgi:hypothetical protein
MLLAEGDDMKTLTRPEMVALAASARVMMMADGQISPGEMDIVARFGAELGLTEAQWSDVWDEGVRTLPTAKAIAAAAALQRDEAREVVYELLYGLATDGTIVDPEWDILEWLDEAWMSAPDSD